MQSKESTGMQALKAIVIGMGALIVLAVVLLAYGLYKKSVDPAWRLFGAERTLAPAVAPAEPVPGDFGPVALDLPDGCRIADVRPSGRRAYVMIGPDDSACAMIFVIDVEDGRVLGRISAK